MSKIQALLGNKRPIDEEEFKRLFHVYPNGSMEDTYIDLSLALIKGKKQENGLPLTYEYFKHKWLQYLLFHKMKKTPPKYVCTMHSFFLRGKYNEDFSMSNKKIERLYGVKG